MSRRVLFVDDEPYFLKAIQRIFCKSNFETYLAESGQSALDLLGKQQMDIVVSDTMMPGMDGYAFLCIVKEKYPDTVRMMLSGYSDERQTVKALQDGTVTLYLTKPWDNQELLNTIERFFTTAERLREQKLLSFMNKTSRLPTLPTIYSHICSLLDGDASLEKIAAEIEQKDPAMAAKILQVTNSALWGVKTGSVKQAILLLGLANIKPIIMATAVFDLKGSTGQSKRVKGELWQRARLTHRAFNWIFNTVLHKKVPDTFASAGLLHEVGRIAMLGEFGSRYVNAIDFDSAQERECFELSHLEVGGSLLAWWNLPHALVEAAMYYEEPLSEQVIERELVAAVHLSHQAAILAIHPFAVLPPVTHLVLASLHLLEPVFSQFAKEQLNTEK